MNDEIIILVGASAYTKDADGNEIETPVQKQIFGDVKSVTSAEFLIAGKLGIKPSCMIEVWRAEYEGEKTVIVGGAAMSIYRTYSKGDRMELHCAERTGATE